MATETPAVTPLTFEMIQAADGKTMALWMKTRRAEVDAVLQAKSEELQTKVADQNARLTDVQQAQAQRTQEIELEQERVRKERAEEVERRRKLTPDERAAEDKAMLDAAQEQERIANEERIAEEKDKAYLSTLRPAERQAELKRREDEAAARELEASNAAAAEQQRLADETAATEKAQKEAADKVAADQAEADRVAAEAAEQEKLLAEKQRLADEEAARPKQKIVVDYQATDDDGNSIGRPTHLEADSWEEMSKKQQDAHVNAVRYAERMKKQASRKPIPARQVTPLKILTPEERTTLEKEAQAGEGTRAEIARIKLEQDAANQELDKERRDREWNRQNEESKIFVAAHQKDFYPCEANAKILADYITTENLDWNSNNLEIAFSKLAHKLAPRPEEVRPQIPANPDPAPPVVARAPEVPAAPRTETPQAPPAVNPPAAPVSVVAPAAPQEVPPTAPTPTEIPAPAAVNPPAPVKRPASGIEPGSLRGGRRVQTPSEPGEKSASEIKREIARMPLDVYKRNLKNPKFRELLKSVGIQA